MRKVVLVLIALSVLLLVAMPIVTADVDNENGTEVDESDTETGDDLVEEEEPKPTIIRKPVARLHLVGSGIAISEGDAFDFMHAKIVIGAVKVRATADDNVNSAFAVRRLGVLMLDEKRYKLRDIAVSLEEISAEVYGPTTETDANAVAIGEITVKRFERPGRDIWAGNLVLNDEAYNVYFLGVKRSFRLGEITQKIGGYCSDNSDDTKCKNIVATCAQNREQCGERIQEHCQNNSTDMSCLQLKKQYCLKNATDERCREYLEDLCEKYPRLKHCRITDVNGEQVVSISNENVSETTAEEGEAESTLVAKKTRPKLQIAKCNIKAISPTATRKCGD